MHAFGSSFLRPGPPAFIRPRARAIPGPHSQGNEMSAADTMAKRAPSPRTPISTPCPSTPSARWRWMRCRRPSPAIPARRWRWRRSPTRSGRTCSATTRGPDLAEPRPVRAERRPCLDAAVRAAAPRRRRTHRRERSRPTSDAVTLDDIKQFRQLEQRDARAIRNTATPRASRRRPGRWARAAATRSAWRWRSAGSPTATTSPASRCTTTAIYTLCGDGDMMEGVSQRGRQRSPGTSSCRTWSGSTTATTSPSRADQPRLQRGRRRPLRRLWLERHRTSTTPTTPTALLGALREAEGVTDRPTMIVVHSIIGYGAPQEGRHPRGARRAARRRRDQGRQALLRLAGGRAVPACPDGVRENFTERHGRARRAAAAKPGWRC